MVVAGQAILRLFLPRTCHNLPPMSRIERFAIEHGGFAGLARKLEAVCGVPCPRDTPRQWVRRGAVPSWWLPHILTLLKHERGARAKPVSADELMEFVHTVGGTHGDTKEGDGGGDAGEARR
jgi:hypothetical protein